MRKIKKLIDISSNQKCFSDTFIQIEHDFSLDLPNNNSLEIFHLRKKNQKFDYSQLRKFCLGNLSRYVFSRAEVDKALDDYDSNILFKEATKKFRDVSNPKDNGAGGELGEILLYLLLEGRLQAPKVLSKMEIKTNKNDYIKGADGVFIHEFKNEKGKIVYQFIVGESKIKNSITEGTKEAFNSIATTLSKLEFEENLVSAQIFKEMCSEEKANVLIDLIVPKDIGQKNIINETACGMFIGYSTSKLEGLENSQWNAKIDGVIKEDVQKALKQAKESIDERDLKNYSFYIYFIPFNDANNDKRRIMSDIIS